VRLQTDTVLRHDRHAGGHLSYGFVDGPGRYETTLTRPDLYGHYLSNQLELLLRNHGVDLEVGISNQPIPVHFALGEHDLIEGELSAGQRSRLRDVFDLPDLTTMDDGIANGTWRAKGNEA
jgi:AMP nucleosidase